MENIYKQFPNSELNNLLESITEDKYQYHEDLIKEILSRLIKLGGLRTDG